MSVRYINLLRGSLYKYWRGGKEYSYPKTIDFLPSICLDLEEELLTIAWIIWGIEIRWTKLYRNY